MRHTVHIDGNIQVGDIRIVNMMFGRNKELHGDIVIVIEHFGSNKKGDDVWTVQEYNNGQLRIDPVYEIALWKGYLADKVVIL